MFEKKKKNKIFKSKNNLNNLYKFQKLVRQYPFASDMPAAAIHKRKGRFARRFRKPPKIANLIKKIEMDKIYLSFVFFRATRMTFANSKSSPFNACCSKIASQFFARRWRRRGKIHCRILNKRKILFKFFSIHTWYAAIWAQDFVVAGTNRAFLALYSGIADASSSHLLAVVTN